jgi:membrane protein
LGEFAVAEKALISSTTASSWSWTKIKPLLLTTYKEWNEDDAPHMGAALAFYTILSLAPLLIIMITIAGWVLGQNNVSSQLMAQIQGLVGTEGAKAIEEMLKSAGNSKKGVIANALGIATLLFGASSVLGELRRALNRIWKVSQREKEGVPEILKKQSRLFGLVLGCGFLLLASLVVSAALAAVGKFMQSALPFPAFVFEAITFLVSLAVITGIFAALFRYIPEVNVAWSDVWVGAAVTSLLFTVGKSLIALYLGKAAIGSTFGAAGSLVVVLVWVYYSSQIVFFGAEFTQVYSKLYGVDNLESGRQSTSVGGLQQPPSWMGYQAPAALTNTLLPPILPIEEPKNELPPLAASIGGLVGSIVALVRSVKTIWKG